MRRALKLARFYPVAAGAVLGSGLVSAYQNSSDTKLFPPVTAGPFDRLKEIYLSKSVQAKGHALSHKEQRFLKYATIEYAGNIFMTPRDFLRSILEDDGETIVGLFTTPATRSRRELNEKEVKEFLRETTALRYSSETFLRSLGDRGLISYSEWLFLLCALTNAEHAFRIAFQMFDIDGNQQVDKNEFLVLERIFYMMDRSKRGSGGDSAVLAHHDTTLLVHLFGQKGAQTLKFDDFKRFVKNLQGEVLQMEFNKFSEGFELMTEEQFLRALLQYTYLDEEGIERFVERLRSRLADRTAAGVEPAKGIGFGQYEAFQRVLNALDDFAMAVELYTNSDLPITKDEFQRAVLVSTEQHLDSELVDVVFLCFDTDNDGCLSYKEFVALMRDRRKRGIKPEPEDDWKQEFYNCYRRTLHSYSYDQ